VDILVTQEVNCVIVRTKDDFLEILFYNRNKVYHKIKWGLGGGFLSIN
jgi:hypothetical protein